MPLVTVELGHGVRAHGCTSCRWTFLPPRAWTRIFDDPGLAATIERHVPVPTILVEGVLPLLSCPTCGTEMDRARFAATSNIVIDTCRLLHGVWLDTGDIAKVLAYAEHKARIGEKAAVREAEDEWVRSERTREAERLRLAMELEREEARAPRPVGMQFATAFVLLVGGVILVVFGLRLIGASCSPRGRDEPIVVPEETPAGDDSAQPQ